MARKFGVLHDALKKRFLQVLNKSLALLPFARSG